MAKLGGLLFLLAFSCSSLKAESDLHHVSMSCSKCTWELIQRSETTKGHSFRPAGYEYVPWVGYYKFYPDKAMSYYQAFYTCQMDGAHLAIINSKEEETVLTAIYARHPNAKTWAYLGFNDIEKEGSYVTIFGQPLNDTGYVNWSKGQPDHHDGDEDCGSLSRHGGLHDLYCDKHGPWPFFCEYDIEESPLA